VQNLAIDDFQANNASVQPGLGILHGVAFEPRLTVDQRWGRLYGVEMAQPKTIDFGIAQTAALVLGSGGAQVSGEGPVIAVDGRAATFATGANGAICALNVVMDTYAPGDTVAG
jgi:cyanophycinase-like exopeptidase